MRKNQFIGFAFVSVCLWALVTYYLFLDRPLNHKPDQKQIQIQEHLSLLELKLNEQFLDGEKLLQQLRNIVKEQQLSVRVNEAGAEGRGVGEEQQLEKQQGEKEDEQVNRMRSLAEEVLPDGGPVIAVLVFACNRITVNKCIDQLLKYRPARERFPIIVSQDCGHRPTADVIELYGDEITRIEQPDQSDIPVPPKEKKFKGYFKIARHYGWALNYTFFKFNFDTVIIVEDDLDIAPDFFEYFLGTYPILKRDPTLWCVSAWNDNGKAGLVDENAPDLLYRTDFFPGLGWMLTKSVWAELAPKWPSSYWDDWVRQPEQRRNRACIRPEISRTRTFGKIGVSNGHFYEKHLKYIKLNEKFVPFTQKNLTYLLKDNYDVQFVKQVYESLVVTYQELKSDSIVSEGSVRIPYHTNDIYKRTAKLLGLMDDFRSGVPRTGYRGVVSFLYKGRRVYLAPNANWKGYDPGWS
ncbi:alpha-1,3-mannosyl-glycoprotein 2-beta-N-acetylglucosaminyltransferase isoform X2 [Cryptotermes secundus]|uniref:alpha-1,3-mannosyl-glycoprotein 2-beta-N-acetylglucosaminyltransferase isoform X2 n=1 Tax=Cryptotermes secundus TaxID=105785 RepID=UPI000CD7C2B8|nr:alpha-1,3-mannosyl-glycoprotein 2-beta-N-acetylglucosaminyltransferase isoform X2 [Cryptotermes secundus]